jgi:DNA-binding NarL/FixJ family response regulator
LSSDPVLRGRFEDLSKCDPTITVIGIVGHSSELLSLGGQKSLDVVIMDSPTREQLEQWKKAAKQPPLLVLIHADDSKNAVSALNAGATSTLDRSAPRRKLIAAIKAAATGLIVLQSEHLGELLDDIPLSAEPLENGTPTKAQLTPRELEVLASMADGASNKAIARRLGISFSTVKFHVASILTKLNADSRTEAVMKAAQSGLVML